MKRDYKVYLQDILECIERIEEYTGGMSYEDFIDDQETVDAVIRNIEIIGEATKHVSDTLLLPLIMKEKYYSNSLHLRKFQHFSNTFLPF